LPSLFVREKIGLAFIARVTRALEMTKPTAASLKKDFG
jgi:hypothetical protein